MTFLTAMFQLIGGMLALMAEILSSITTAFAVLCVLWVSEFFILFRSA